MLPKKLPTSACYLESSGQQSQCTQTCSTSIDKVSKSPSRCSRPPLPRDISNSDNGSITVFELCQILQDPDNPKDVTIIKETVSEETKPHHSNDKDKKSPTSSEEATGNRYKYCREVIKPYLKPSTNCQESEEELLKNALDSVSEDFPDYQPCFEVFETQKDLHNKITGNISRKGSISKADATTSTVSLSMDKKVNEPPCSVPVNKCKKPSSPCDSSPPPQNEKPTEDNKNCSACPQQPCPVIPDCCPKEPAIAVTCKKPTYYLTERCKDNAIPHTHEREKSVAENQNATMSSIKVAIEDFVGKVCNTTKNVVTLITTESAKQIDKMKQTKPASESNGCKKCEAAKCSETSYNLLRKVDSAESDDKSCGKPDQPKIKDVISGIMTKVDSTLITVTDALSVDNMPECLKPSNLDEECSPYDPPSPPREVSNIIESPAICRTTIIPPVAIVPASNSVFTTIKDKIVALFGEESKPTKSKSLASTVTSLSSSSSLKNQESEKVIE